MTDAETILSLIKTCDTNDDLACQELRSRVWCYRRGFDFVEQVNYKHFTYRLSGDPELCYEHPDYAWFEGEYYDVVFSRDALKSIRPEGWGYRSAALHRDGEITMRLTSDGTGGYYADAMADTEELAELAAIVQAIEHERGQP